MLERKPRVLLHAVDGVSFDDRARQDAGAGGRIRLRQEHRGARCWWACTSPRAAACSFDGQDAHAAFKTPQGRTLRRRIQMIFQDPYASLNPRWIVEDIVGEPLREHGILQRRGRS